MVVVFKLLYESTCLNGANDCYVKLIVGYGTKFVEMF